MYGSDPTRQKRRQATTAALLAVMGLAALSASILWSSFPSAVLLWLGFALAHVYFEWNAVEVNDRLLASPTIIGSGDRGRCLWYRLSTPPES